MLLSLIRPISKLVAGCVLCVSVSQTVSAEEFTNFLGMKFVSIPAGSFDMGVASKTLEASLDELPQRKVRVDDFQIMPTEVTLAQYKRFIIESTKIDMLQDEFMDTNAHGDNAPVVFVSWNDVRFFLHWINENKPESDSGEYMLPTEAEWEYACRAGGEGLYCGGDSAEEVAWYASKKIGFQQTVARKKPNAFGLYDMSGNVREWVQDCYHSDYKDAPDDGSVAWNRNCQLRSTYVTRGGSWDEGKDAARTTDRLAAKFNKRDSTIGFRVVRKKSRWE